MTSTLQSENALRVRLRATGRGMAFTAATAADAERWRAKLRAQLATLLGLQHMQTAPLRPRITETVACGGYRRERVEIDTEPGITMPLFVLIPDGLNGPAPAVIAAHGHGSAGKSAVAGLDDDPRVAAKIAEHNYAYGVQAARAGFVVFCPDARGFGERRERLSAGPDQVLDSSCFQLAHMALPLGITVAGMWTWDLMRLLDYIGTREETRDQRIGCIGFSGGGLQTLYLAALDERVACAAISGYYYGVEDSLLHQSENCACNYVPGLWRLADIGDLGALIAPHPLLIESARHDSLNGPRGMDNVHEQIAVTQRAFDTCGVSDRLATAAYDGGHRWHGDAVWPWLRRWL